MNRSIWKPSYVNYFLINTILKNKKRTIIRTKARSSTILQSFIGLNFAVYNGRKYVKFYIDRKMVGHKLGEFSFTRKVGRVHEKRLKNPKGSLKKAKKKGTETVKAPSKKINDKRKDVKK